jgi:hypothetical protein
MVDLRKPMFDLPCIPIFVRVGNGLHMSEYSLAQT